MSCSGPDGCRTRVGDLPGEPRLPNLSPNPHPERNASLARFAPAAALPPPLPGFEVLAAEALSEHERGVLEAFEDPTYKVELVELRTGRRGLVYVWPEQALPSTWTTSLLDDQGWRAYSDRCTAWRARFDE